MVLQCRGHEITTGMHPQYDLFKQWTTAKRPVLEAVLADRFLLFGEWLYAKHSVHYRRLPHYFFEFDIYDKRRGEFLDLDTRLAMIAGRGIATVPVLRRGAAPADELRALIGPARFDSASITPARAAPTTSWRGCTCAPSRRPRHRPRQGGCAPSSSRRFSRANTGSTKP